MNTFVIASQSLPRKYHYCGSPIVVTLRQWPILIPERLSTSLRNPLGSWRGASSRRMFYLGQDWDIKIEATRVCYGNSNVEGTITIPTTYVSPEGKSVSTRLDGASVPLPWLVSFLSLGILRPLGVMLIASIVHDFAYEHGGLVYRCENQEPVFRPIKRHIADQLFFDIIKTVNEMPVIALLAWLAVRLGWVWVKYSGERWQGRPPFFAFAFLILLSLAFAELIQVFGVQSLAWSLLGGYLGLFLLLQIVSPTVQNPSQDAEQQETCVSEQ